MDAKKEVMKLARKSNGTMSENLKNEIARELGVFDIVEKEGWGSVSSQNCGLLVKRAIEIANQQLQK